MNLICLLKEESSWTPILKQVSNEVKVKGQLMGIINGMDGLEPPKRRDMGQRRIEANSIILDLTDLLSDKIHSVPLFNIKKKIIQICCSCIFMITSHSGGIGTRIKMKLKQYSISTMSYIRERRAIRVTSNNAV